MNRKLALYSLSCFYKIKERTPGSCPAGDSRLAVDPFDLSHSSAGQPVRDDDSVPKSSSSPMPPTIPFSWEQRGSRGAPGSGGISPCAFQPPRAGAKSCPSTQPDLDDQNSSVKAAGSDKQAGFKYLLELVQSKALSLQLPSPGGVPHLLACSPFCLPLCLRLRSEISSNTWQAFPIRVLLKVWASGLRFGLKNVLSHRSWIFIQLPSQSYSGLRQHLKLRVLLISVLQNVLTSFSFYMRFNKEYLCLSDET